MDQWEQTPKGVWYPTRVGCGSIQEHKEKKATWYHFFLDFHADDARRTLQAGKTYRVVGPVSRGSLRFDQPGKKYKSVAPRRESQGLESPTLRGLN